MVLYITDRWCYDRYICVWSVLDKSQRAELAHWGSGADLTWLVLQLMLTIDKRATSHDPVPNDLNCRFVWHERTSCCKVKHEGEMLLRRQLQTHCLICKAVVMHIESKQDVWYSCGASAAHTLHMFVRAAPDRWITTVCLLCNNKNGGYLSQSDVHIGL